MLGPAVFLGALFAVGFFEASSSSSDDASERRDDAEESEREREEADFADLVVSMSESDGMMKSSSSSDAADRFRAYCQVSTANTLNREAYTHLISQETS